MDVARAFRRRARDELVRALRPGGARAAPGSPRDRVARRPSRARRLPRPRDGPRERIAVASAAHNGSSSHPDTPPARHPAYPRRVCPGGAVVRPSRWRGHARNGERRRVVVTGIGLITPLGATVQKTWDALVAGRSGIGPITRFDPSGLETTIAGEVRDFDALDYMDRKEVRRADRFVQFAVAAAGQALKGACLEITPDLASRVGAAFGSGIGGVETLVDNILKHDEDPRKVSPFLIPMMIIDMAAGEIAMKYGAKGPNMARVPACAESAHAIGEATEK